MRIADYDHSSDGEEETQRGKLTLASHVTGVTAQTLFDFSVVLICQIIEKRRRDRINNSLSELRRLVPTAFEKQVRVCFCGAIRVLTSRTHSWSRLFLC